jgi:hypothetical protein
MSDDKSRRRMVVEEVGVEPNGVINSQPVEEIKEKVEELQTLTENISESVEKSADVQEEIAKAVEEVSPSDPIEKLKQEYPGESMPAMPQIQRGTGPNPLMIIIPGIFLLGALLGGIVFYQNRVSGTTPTPTQTPDYSNSMTPAPSPVATTPATTTLDLTKYQINVMNGSGTPGLAGTVKTDLEAAGFKVAKTGNAPSYDFTKTVIKVKADVPEAFITKLTETLNKNYVVDTKQSLAASSTDSVQVIIGSTKAK